jgi:hypothetical protein
VGGSRRLDAVVSQRSGICRLGKETPLTGCMA